MQWGRRYLAVQAVAGAAWWIAVWISPTLGGLDPVAVAILDVPLFVVASAIAASGVRAAAVVATVWTMLVTIGLAGYATVTGEAGWGVVFMIAASCGSAVALCLVLLGRVPTEWIIAGPFAFRPAGTRTSPTAHVWATAAQIVVFWGLFLWVFPVLIAALEQRWGLSATVPWLVDAARPVGVVVFVLASALGIWAAATMSTRGDGTPLPAAMPNRLVIAGPYRHVRNPMALAGIVQGAAVGLVLGSWLVVAYAIAGSLLWNFAIRPLEEADLEARFGDDFRRYRAAVRCWRPRLTAVSAAELGREASPLTR
ncbi:methyltransferase family protein [Agromyces allii]|uniref:Isoprenylcysteine carboxylmethyltransferase family protein n=1 Tax=Agromyces allii TaxID=393607 RepID=A0ABN2QPF8_9MICO|nr:isoprenylcysteine carboxylmethyltransferase family protein [Agromyces allii]